MELTEQTINELKNIEISIFKCFIGICDKNNLRYFLIGGTLLGAVRHGGFIPWDDDIDVGMPRKDYEAFLKEAPKYLPEYYFIQTCKTDPYYPNNYMKIRDSRTTFLESTVKHLRINHGVFIDVFPLDEFPKNKWVQYWFNLNNRLLSNRISEIFSNTKENNIKRSFIKKVVITLYNKKVPTVQCATEKRERLLSKHYKGDYLANYSGAWGIKEIIPKSWYGTGKKWSFEGIDVIIPLEYDKWLTQVYGDYMKLPPIEKRVTHHYTEIIDLKRSYKDYVGE